MPIRLPIYFLNDKLQTVARPHHGRPMVHIGVTGNLGTDINNVTYNNHWALIDTGADLNCADVPFLDTIEAQRISVGEVIGVTGRAISFRRSISLILGDPQNATAVTTDVMELNSVHDTTKPYSLILGNLFLECGCLHIDSRNEEFWFDYYGGHPRAF